MGGGCRNFTNVSLRQRRKKRGRRRGAGGLCLDESEKDIKEAIESAAARRAKLRAGRSAGEGRRGALAQGAGVGAGPLWRRPRARSAAPGGGTEAPIEWPPSRPCPLPPMPRPGLGSSGRACSDPGAGRRAGGVPGGPTLSLHPDKGAGRADSTGVLSAWCALRRVGLSALSCHATLLLDWAKDRGNLGR